MDLTARGTAFLDFWTERHLCVLAQARPDGTVHAVPVGATLQPEVGVARVICSRGSYKARNVAAAEPPGRRVAVTQVDGRRWSTLEGWATLLDDRDAVAEAERRYAERYRTPRPNPERVVLLVRIDRVLGL